MHTTAVCQPQFSVSFGDNPAISFAGLPVLGGKHTEPAFSEAVAEPRIDDWQLFRENGWLLGVASRSIADIGLERATMELYDSLLSHLGRKHLCRIWNYVPSINEAPPAALENYRTFCRERSLAFSRHFGAGYKAKLPAACAVGSRDNILSVVFAAHDTAPLHLENPAQTPAYEYPPEHGPASPSFARATVLRHACGRRDVFISGTSAIKGHQTIFPGNTSGQLEVTLENLRTIGAMADLNRDLPHATAQRRIIKVYLRDAEDFAETRKVLERRLLQPADHVSYLHTDICRAELNVEIDITLFGAHSV